MNHDSFVPTSIHLQLVDQSIRRPSGIAEDIPVRIRNSFIPVDFMVLKMDACRQIQLILGRPFLSTTGDTIDVAARKRRHSHSNPMVPNNATKSWSRSDRSGML
jgi:hypothetical protein